MKTGRNLMALATELEAQSKGKRDFLSPTSKLRMMDGSNLVIDGHGQYTVTNHTHGQIADYIGIPTKYYNRMQEAAPALLATNVNHWFQKEPKKRMLRTMTLPNEPAGRKLRAFLSDRYRPLDNYDLTMSVVPFMLQEYGKPLEIRSCEVTESRLYIKVIAPHTERDISTFLKPGSHSALNEPVRSGFIVSNSEIGAGALSVQVFTEILRCSNGAVIPQYGQKKYHAGKKLGGGDGAEDLADFLSDDTRKLEDAAFWSRVKDAIRACLSEDRIGDIYTKMAEARGMKLEAPPDQVVEVLATKYQFNESQKSGLLQTLVESGMGLTAYGVFNAVTEIAKADDIDYDAASRIEQIGGEILTLSPADWKAISSGKAA